MNYNYRPVINFMGWLVRGHRFPVATCDPSRLHRLKCVMGRTIWSSFYKQSFFCCPVFFSRACVVLVFLSSLLYFLLSALHHFNVISCLRFPQTHMTESSIRQTALWIKCGIGIFKWDLIELNFL